MSKSILLTAVAALIVSFAFHSELSAATFIPTVIYSETFDTDAADLTAIEATYPELTGVGGSQFSVSSGSVQLVRSGNNVLRTVDTFNEEIWVSGRVGIFSGTAGSNAEGLVIGNRVFDFFSGNGAFRIHNFNPTTGALGSQLSSPTNIPLGFVPAYGELHQITVHSDNVGNFDVIVENTANPSMPFSQSFSFPGFVPGPVGFTGLFGSATTRYDDLTVVALREFVPIPEPSSCLLLGLGALGLIRVTRNRIRSTSL